MTNNSVHIGLYNIKSIHVDNDDPTREVIDIRFSDAAFAADVSLTHEQAKDLINKLVQIVDAH